MLYGGLSEDKVKMNHKYAAQRFLGWQMKKRWDLKVIYIGVNLCETKAWCVSLNQGVYKQLWEKDKYIPVDDDLVLYM